MMLVGRAPLLLTGTLSDRLKIIGLGMPWEKSTAYELGYTDELYCWRHVLLPISLIQKVN